MPVKIKGRVYFTCAERLHALAESGKVYEVLESAPFQAGDRWGWKVAIKIEDRIYIGNAEIHLAAHPGSADHTDPLACAETSAWARALGWAGYGVLDGIASADEIIRSENAQESRQNGHQRMQSQEHAQQRGKADNALKDKLNAVYALGKGIGCYTDIATFGEFVRDVLILDIADVRLLSAEQLSDVEDAILQIRQQQQEGPDPDVLQSLAEAALEAPGGRPGRLEV